MSQSRKHTISQTMTGYLESVRRYVAETITDPSTGKPLQIPHYETMKSAAERLCSSEAPADIASILSAFLGRGSSFDMNPGPTQSEMQFPADHHIHPDLGGMEFYILAANLETVDSKGRAQDIGVTLWIQKNRMVGLSAQREAHWSDADTLVGSSMATAVLAPHKPSGDRTSCVTSSHVRGSAKGAPAQSAKAGEELIFERDKNRGGRKVRRSRLLQWPIVGGEFAYSKPGEPFRFSCGPDSFSGGENVLPLRAQVSDGGNLSFDLTANCLRELEVEKAFFLQEPAGPSGFQVNWPQLEVSGALTVEGERYEVTRGTGTVVHQALPTSLKNADGAERPIPYVDDPSPFIGWAWQWFNLDNKDAAIFAGVNVNNFSVHLQPFGVYAKLNGDGGWATTLIDPTKSAIALGDFYANPTVTSQPGPERPSAIMPTTWKYQCTSAESSVLLDGFASAWAQDGSFNINDWSLFSELPVTYYDSSGKGLPGGKGYCESFGFESTIQYYDRCLAMLRSGKVPE